MDILSVLLFTLAALFILMLEGALCMGFDKI